MDPRKLFCDERLKGFCVHCGGKPTTRDHIPPKVFLDEPYPNNLPFVPSCEDCNEDASLDEQYVACAIECAISGSANSEKIQREKIRVTLTKRPALASQLAASSKEDHLGNLLWEIDTDRFKGVMIKMARGHAAYENSEQQWYEPTHVSFAALSSLTEGQLAQFESVEENNLLPEIGSRAFLRGLRNSSPLSNSWIIVQPDRYRYRIRCFGPLIVQMVFSEYLAAEVVWSD